MEYLERPLFKEFTKEDLSRLKVDRPDKEIEKRILKNWDLAAKPIDGMGSFETLTARIGSILESERIDISKKAVIIMCADNGIVEENISQSGQEVTAAVARAMAVKRSCVCRMAKITGADTIPVDIGINMDGTIQGIVDKKIRRGTRNFLKEPAMTESEAVKALSVGMDMVRECKAAGYKIVATGELGIGNTTTSSAVTAALLGCGAAEVTGRGAGLSDEGLSHKIQVIEKAVEKYDLKNADALTVLAAVGGLDIAGLAGVCIGGAVFHVPVVLDGVISMTAALTAQRLVSGVSDYIILSHKGKEKAVKKLMEELGQEPVIDAHMALGEGTGAVMMLSLLDLALSIYNDRLAFSDIGIEQYKRFT